MKLRAWIVVSVLFVWVMNFIASLIPVFQYASDPAIHAVFMAVVGGTIALGVKDKKNGDDKS